MTRAKALLPRADFHPLIAGAEQAAFRLQTEIQEVEKDGYSVYAVLTTGAGRPWLILYREK